MKLLNAGTEIADLKLLDSKGQEVNIRDITRSLTLLYFYPKAMTPGCTTQACLIRDGKDLLLEHNLDVYGISCDPPARLEKFIHRDNLNFPLLSDPDHQICSYFGAWGPKKLCGREYEGIYRVSFLVKNNRILANFPGVKPKEHLDLILAWLADHPQG